MIRVNESGGPEGVDMHILLVESDTRLASCIASGLRRNGHTVEHTVDGVSAIGPHRDSDLVLLDLATPDMDGLEVCRVMRSDGDVPIIATAHGDSEMTRVLALQTGSDDCIEKPFGFRELLARIDAVTRRAYSGTTTRRLSYGALTIDPRVRQASISGRSLTLTEKEFDLLFFLASRPGSVVSREELMAEVWGDRWNKRSRTIDTHVSSLRGKLGEQSWISTVRGVGFRFCDRAA
jgi:DNA-binding response OmpR family regulator